MRRPFTLYKEKTKSGMVWYARFWDETAQRYKHSRSTGVPVEGKKERRYEAEKAAEKLVAEVTATITASLAKVVSSQPPQPIPVTVTNAVADTPLITYLENFWTPESDYAHFKRDVEKDPLDPYYISMNHDDVRRHVQPFPIFQNLTVGTLNKAILKKWMIWLAGRRKITQKKDGTITDHGTISSRRANSIMQTVRVAIRYAFDNEDIPSDPFHKLGEVTEIEKEKGVLTFDERELLTTLPITNYKARLAMLLGSYCALRRGEIRGLQWGDIANGIITVQHNYQDKGGLKLPKYKSIRKVTITSAIQDILDYVYKKAIVKKDGVEIHPSPDSYIFVSPKNAKKPVSTNFFRNAVKNELINLGITVAQQKERFLSPHSLRHTFVTLAQLAGIPDVIIRALAGHKSEQSQRKYSHVPQVINFADVRKRLEAPLYQPLKATA